MVSTRQFSLRPTQLGFGILIAITALAAVLLLEWIINDVKSDADKVAGLTLIITLLGTVSTMIQKKSDSQINTKNANIAQKEDKSLEQSAIQVLMALNEAKLALSDEDIIKLLNERQKEQAQNYIKRVRDVEKYFEICQDIAIKLASDQNDDKIQDIAESASDKALENLGNSFQENTNLTPEDEKVNRFPLYEDIYIYLKVWLKNSIKYDIEMPDINRKLIHREAYIETLKLIKREYLDDFPGTSDSSKAVLQKFLGILIDNLESHRF